MADTQTTTNPRIPTWTVGDRLRKARDEAGISPTQMGDYLGRDKSTVNRYEKARHVHKLVLEKYAEWTGAPIEWLRDGTEPDNGPNTGAVTVHASRGQSCKSRSSQEPDYTYSTAA